MMHRLSQRGPIIFLKKVIRDLKPRRTFDILVYYVRKYCVTEIAAIEHGTFTAWCSLLFQHTGTCIDQYGQFYRPSLLFFINHIIL